MSEELGLTKVQGALSVRDIREQVNLIQGVMGAVMQKGIHYDVIPGCQKPSILKAGCEKLLLTFRLSADYETARKELPNEHREYEAKCTLRHIPTGQMVGAGIGMCSTMEANYRWREQKLACPACGMQLRKSKDRDEFYCWAKKGGCGKKFPAGAEAITKQATGRTENPEIADCYNTVLKMSEIRALRHATLGATAASDIFTQEMDQGEPEEGKRPAPRPDPTPRPASTPSKGSPKPQGEFRVLDEPIPQDYRQNKADYNARGFFPRKIGGVYNRETRKTEGGEWAWGTTNPPEGESTTSPSQVEPTTQEEADKDQLEKDRDAVLARLKGAGYSGVAGWKRLRGELSLPVKRVDLTQDDLDEITSMLDQYTRTETPREPFIEDLYAIANARGLRPDQVDSRAQAAFQTPLEECTVEQIQKLTTILRSLPATAPADGGLY